jgi:Spy/CpxP family protein refolding chaperone
MPLRHRALISFVMLIMLISVAAITIVDAGEQRRRPHRWWQSAQVQELLELTDRQSTSLDKIYRWALPKLRDSMHRLDAEETTLDRLVGDMDVEETDVTRQIDRVEATRSELSKTRFLMLFRMLRVLTQDQRDGLDAWQKADDKRMAPTPDRRR